MTNYNLSQIMKVAHNMYRTGKYTSFSDALRKSWKTAKFRKQIEAERSDTISFHELQKREAQERVMMAERIKAERIARLAELKAQAERERAERAAKVEAEANAYGYGRGEHYSAWSGWGNYYGD